MDGNYYDLVAENDNTISFAPLSNIKSKADRIWAEDWLEMVCGLHEVKFDATKSRKIREALNTHIDTGAKTLTDFVALVQDDDISEALSFYTVKGSIDILDGDDDTLTTSHISTFELGELMELGDKVVLPILLYIFQIIEKSLDGSPTAIWIDESWTVLGHPIFSPRIRKWLKELRKKNCFVFMATQSLSDAVNSGILDVLQESCPTKIFLPNPEAFKKGSENGVLGPYDFYQAFGLNDQQIKIVYNAIPKREYYYTSPEGNRKFSLVFNEYTLAFCAAADVDDVTYIEKLIKDDKPNWISNWLNHRLN
jgi:type IV secretion system protein VirB4